MNLIEADSQEFPHGSPDSGVQEDRRLEPSAGLDGIDPINKLRTVIASAVIDLCEYRDRTCHGSVNLRHPANSAPS